MLDFSRLERLTEEGIAVVEADQSDRLYKLKAWCDSNARPLVPKEASNTFSTRL